MDATPAPIAPPKSLGAGRGVRTGILRPPAVKLTLLERQTLFAWRGMAVDYGFGFTRAAQLCSTPPRLIRRTVRALARKGMVRFVQMLWQDNEQTPAGGGYVLTQLGADALADMQDGFA